jgi:hypothetical protein
MRFTFVILLFCCLGADAQMIIKAHANYVPFAAGNLLLDQYSGSSAGYSLRKIRTAYSGSAIRVRRSNDNTEQDIGFTSAGDLDTASLKTFVGANSGFVTTWYDQSTNARNATQTTAANQPRIINAGTVERENGKPSIRLDGTNDGLIISTAISLTSHSIFDVKSTTNTITSSTTAIFLYSGEFAFSASYDETIYGYGSVTANLTNERQFFITSSPSINPSIATVLGYGQTSNNISGQKLNSVFYNGNTTFNFYENNSLITLSTSVGGGFTSARNPKDIKCIGYRFSNSTGFFNGKLQEIIIYGSDQSSNRTGIETNINSYYGIY